MAIDVENIFLVDACSDPVVLKIEGRANYMNCGPIGEFFERTLKQGNTNFVIDFAHCSGMDSTFLGIIAGVALELRKLPEPGQLTLSRLGPRNMELIRNLGLHRLVTVVGEDEAGDLSSYDPNLQEVESAQSAPPDMILKAHENLVEADQGNRRKFQDVISFLKNQVDQD